MTKSGVLILEGCSSKKYPFDIYEAGTLFKPIGGVYHISARSMGDDDKGYHSHIYIGRTDNLSTRFDNHHKQKCFDKNNANCISIHECESEKEREEIEKDLLCKYKTLCNDQLN